MSPQRQLQRRAQVPRHLFTRSGAVVPGDPEGVAVVAWAALQGLASMVNSGMLDDGGLDALVADAVDRMILGLRPR